MFFKNQILPTQLGSIFSDYVLFHHTGSKNQLSVIAGVLVYSLSPLKCDGHDEEDGDSHGNLLGRVQDLGEEHQVEVGRQVEAGPGNKERHAWKFEKNVANKH